MNTSDTLYLAADLIEERGWTYGSKGWNSSGGALCLEGGIAAAMGIDMSTPGWSSPLIDCPAYKAVDSYLERNSGLLFAWNDDPFRSATEVIGVLRAAAVVEAARESQPAGQVTA